jgi:hypothetical protein
MEAIRRQIHDESTMITMLDKNLDNDQRELDALNEAEINRAEQVSLIKKKKEEFYLFKIIFRLNVSLQIYKLNAIH